MRREYKSISEIFGDSLHVMKSNLTTYLIIFVAMGIIGGVVAAISFLTIGNNFVNFLVSMFNTAVGSVMAIIYIGTVSNTMQPENASDLGECVSENFGRVFLTQILLMIVIFVPSVILLSGIMFAVFSSGSFGLMMFILFIYAIIIIAVTIRMVFLIQGIVLSQKSYWQAIKWSWNKTSGHIGMIIGIGLAPALVSGLTFTLIRMNMMTTPLIVILGILSAIVGIAATLSFTILYIDVVEPEYTEQQTFQIFEDQF